LLILVLLKIRNAAFPLPVSWAYFGIYQFLKAPEGFNGEYNLLQTIALVGMILLLLIAVVQLIRNRFSVIPVVEK
jgi:benzodiazapine receptor